MKTQQAYIMETGSNQVQFVTSEMRGPVEHIEMKTITTANPSEVIALTIPSVDHLALEAI